MGNSDSFSITGVTPPRSRSWSLWDCQARLERALEGRMLVYIMDIWKESFSHTWLPCVRTNLIYFKNLATGSLFCLFLLGREGGPGLKSSSKLWFAFVFFQI